VTRHAYRFFAAEVAGVLGGLAVFLCFHRSGFDPVHGRAAVVGRPAFARAQRGRPQALQRGNRNRATLAVARQLAAYLLAVDRDERAFVIRGQEVTAA
jgi:hypothetical protein